VKTYSVQLYQPKFAANWNAFVGQAKNATFLFHRDFMEYHQDRFDDYSLVVTDQDKWVAILPANKLGNEIYSHQGLSYGGLLVLPNIRTVDYFAIFSSLCQFLIENEITQLNLKALPRIYEQSFSDELYQALYVTKAQQTRSDLFLVVDKNEPYQPNRNRKRALKVAQELGIKIKEETQYDSFWDEVLTPNLQQRFGVNPVHSLAEITQLADAFPQHIKLFNAYLDGALKAGCVLFIMPNVVHFQYSSGTDDRMDTAALDVLFDYVIQRYQPTHHVSFGNVSEQNGLKINQGLAYWKESFGAKPIVQTYWTLPLQNAHLLEAL
jgi:hypothetical protein